ncbi:MAG: carbamoyltransferase HypF [Acidobacteria bacterium]|nr:carbamoyltransferase HypF [Acidobacteriota bacterium]
MENLEKQNLVTLNPLALQILIRGVIQGIGFRPFVYRLATKLNLTGWVINSSDGVVITLEGTQNLLEEFLLRLEKEKPQKSSIHNLEVLFISPKGYKHFEILESSNTGKKTTLVMPDIASCGDCLKELFDLNDRRYLYPFINCTNCGPRYSIIKSLPYDRPNTTMNHFLMCSECLREYQDPNDRRFHAQPNACWNCGPQLELWDIKGKVVASDKEVLDIAVCKISNGAIFGVKGIGGFHLMVDATNEEAIRTLRERKNRQEKPFALMYPSLELIKKDCEVNSFEQRLLLSPESPIVLLKRKELVKSKLANSIAPNNPYLGVMLPYSPLHHILLKKVAFALVATSGNLSDEPICIDEEEALKRLGSIVDFLLVHNRPIYRQVDDSVAQVVLNQEMLLRRGRGYAPLPISVKETLPNLIAVGAHLKNSVAISLEKNIFISQHIGDLETTQAFDGFKQTILSLKNIYEFKAEAVACDLHPNYLSTAFAEEMSLPKLSVQHHYAHVLSCMADNGISHSVLGVAWDGTGYGIDSTIWGGEFLNITERSFERVAHLRTFPLLGASKAIKEPARAALGLLYKIFGDKLFTMKELNSVKAFTQKELEVYKTMLKKDINTPSTSSIGRLFDIVASIIGLRQKVNFEGQAAMELEFSIDKTNIADYYPIKIIESRPAIIDWEPIILGIINDVALDIPITIISAKFHNSLIHSIITVAKGFREKPIVLTGGCFQNRYLIERSVSFLKKEGFEVYFHQQIPPNDGGIALGQIIAASRCYPKA